MLLYCTVVRGRALYAMYVNTVAFALPPCNLESLEPASRRQHYRPHPHNHPSLEQRHRPGRRQASTSARASQEQHVAHHTPHTYVRAIHNPSQRLDRPPLLTINRPNSYLSPAARATHPNSHNLLFRPSPNLRCAPASLRGTPPLPSPSSLAPLRASAPPAAHPSAPAPASAPTYTSE
eukprot:scaffold3476_cov112-Isochrysis_galbana.AAC.1